MLHVLTRNQRRGAESFGLELASALTSRGHVATPVALASSPGTAKLPVPVLGRTTIGVPTLRRLRARGRAVDVVVAHGSRTLPACVLALLGTRVPVVYVNIGDPLYWARTRLRRLRVRFFLSRVARVVARSPDSAAALTSWLDVPPVNIRVIGNGRDVNAYLPVDDNRRALARAALGLDHVAGQFAIVLGALAPEKRVDLAIEAVAQIPSLALIVAGDGPQRADLEALAARRAPGRVHFLGLVERSAEALAAADVLLLTSESEGLPGVLIEAGLSALPVVATDVGFVRDIVQHDVTGLLVPPDDARATAQALETALQRRKSLGEQARRHCVAAFDLATVADCWEAMLRELVGGRGT